jgi:hypothetical protein
VRSWTTPPTASAPYKSLPLPRCTSTRVDCRLRNLVPIDPPAEGVVQREAVDKDEPTGSGPSRQCPEGDTLRSGIATRDEVRRKSVKPRHHLQRIVEGDRALVNSVDAGSTVIVTVGIDARHVGAARCDVDRFEERRRLQHDLGRGAGPWHNDRLGETGRCRREVRRSAALHVELESSIGGRAELGDRCARRLEPHRGVRYRCPGRSTTTPTSGAAVWAEAATVRSARRTAIAAASDLDTTTVGR